MRDSSLSKSWSTSPLVVAPTQRTRLVTMCLGTALALVVSGVVLSGVGRAPPRRPRIRRSPRPHRTPAPVRRAVVLPRRHRPPAIGLVAVSAVPSVNLLDGVDTATNRPVAVRVLGIRATPPCWAEQARAHAVRLVRDTQVWLASDDEHQPDPDGRAPARALLPEGHDYAHAVVSIGAAQPDTSRGTAPNQEDLTAAETDARQAQRGVWGPACDTNRTGDPSNPSGPSPADEQVVDQKTTTHQQPPAPGRPPGQPSATTTTPPTQDDVQRGVRVGAPCSPEGARGVTDKVENVVCTAKAGSPARWRKA